MGYEDLKDLNQKHKAVARYLALGVSLSDICDQFGFNLTTWKQIVNAPIFKHEVERINGELEERILEDAVKDPVHLKLKMAATKAANRLIEEIDAAGEDSNASSRIRAAESILDRCGYNSKETDKSQQVIFVGLTPDKLDAILTKKEITPQPQSVQG